MSGCLTQALVLSPSFMPLDSWLLLTCRHLGVLRGADMQFCHIRHATFFSFPRCSLTLHLFTLPLWHHGLCLSCFFSPCSITPMPCVSTLLAARETQCLVCAAGILLQDQKAKFTAETSVALSAAQRHVQTRELTHVPTP